MIGHLDADCFYVSAERVRLPILRGRPVGVLGNQGACVIAKSYEMRDAGVKTGMPIWDAVKLCPTSIFVKRDFRWYEVLSRRMLEVLQTVSPTVEYYSIDEFFFDASRVANLSDASALQAEILRKVGVPVSMGIGPTKSIAKLASDVHKPFGVTVLADSCSVEQLLKIRPAADITGIGKRSAAKLQAHGITTCYDFANADRRLIRKLLTKRGEDYWWELRGTPVQPIQTERPPHKNISRGGSLGESTADIERLTAWVARNCERMVEELDYYQVSTSRLHLSLIYKHDDGYWSGSCSLPAATHQYAILVRATKHLLHQAMRTPQLVTGMHLVAEKLSYRSAQQISLFDEPSERDLRIAQVKKQINDRVGRFALRSAKTLPLTEIYADQTHSYDICDVHGKMCF